MARTGPRLTGAHILAIAVVAACGSLLVGRYLMAVRGAPQRQGTGACVALDPETQSRAAPDFDLPDLSGKRQKLSNLRGKVVLLNFWLTTCPPCVEELPSMARFQQAMASWADDFALLTVSVDESTNPVKKFLEQYKTLFGSLPVLIDPSHKVSTAFGTTKFPETYLIDRDGTIRYRFINKRDWASPAALECVRSLM